MKTATIVTFLLHICQESSHLLSLTDLILTIDGNTVRRTEAREANSHLAQAPAARLQTQRRFWSRSLSPHFPRLCQEPLSLKNSGWCIHAVGQGWSRRVLEIEAKPSGIPDVPRDPRTRQRA